MILALNISGCRSTENSISEQDSETISDTADDLQSQTDTVSISDSESEEDKIRRDSLTQVYKDQIYAENQAKANRITTFYILAQQKFYSAEYQEALFLINQAARVKETADVLALKGSIYFGLGSIENFITFWRRALDIDKDLPIPPSPAIVEELKKQGLINEIPEGNFK